MTLPYDVVYLDLDRTLFRTDDFMSKLWQTLADLYGWAKLTQESNRLAGHYVHQDDGQKLYDLSAHLKEVNIEPADAYGRLHHSKLAGDDWLYPDAVKLVGWLSTHSRVEILTYGAHDFQRLKLDFCPKLADVPATIIQTDKADWLRGKTSTLLIDDKPVAAGEGVDVLQIVHGGARQGDATGQRVYGSLSEVLAQLQQNVDK